MRKYRKPNVYVLISILHLGSSLQSSLSLWHIARKVWRNVRKNVNLFHTFGRGRPRFWRSFLMFLATFLLFCLSRSRAAITRFVIEVRGCSCRRQGGNIGFLRDPLILQLGRSFTCRCTLGDNQRIEIAVTSLRG